MNSRLNQTQYIKNYQMRISILIILLSLFLFITCSMNDNPFSPNKDDLTGNWILVKQKLEKKKDGEIINVTIQNYSIIASCYLYRFTKNKMTTYIHLGDDIDNLTTTFSLSEGKIFVGENEYTNYKTQENTLVLSNSKKTGSVTFCTDNFFEKYYEEIPPGEWSVIKKIPDNANSIKTDGTVFNGNIEISGVDWYVFNATSGKTYVIETTGDFDTYLRLYKVIENDELTLIAADDDGGAGENAQIYWTCSSTETYYFSVRETDDMETGYYGISVISSPVCSVETNPKTGEDK